MIAIALLLSRLIVEQFENNLRIRKETVGVCQNTHVLQNDCALYRGPFILCHHVARFERIFWAFHHVINEWLLPQ